MNDDPGALALYRMCSTVLDGARRTMRELNVPLLLKPFSVEAIRRLLERSPHEPLRIETMCAGYSAVMS